MFRKRESRESRKSGLLAISTPSRNHLTSASGVPRRCTLNNTESPSHASVPRKPSRKRGGPEWVEGDGVWGWECVEVLRENGQ